MNAHVFLMTNLRKLVYSRYSNLLAPEGWGVRIEGVHATNPQNMVVSYFTTYIRNAYAVSDGRRMIVLPLHWEEFMNEHEPNRVFREIVGEEHPYRLEWYWQTIPNAYFEWINERIERFLYPFDMDIHYRSYSRRRFWWAGSKQETILLAHPLLDYFDKDGNPVFVKYKRDAEQGLGIQPGTMPGLDDDETDGEE